MKADYSTTITNFGLDLDFKDFVKSYNRKLKKKKFRSTRRLQYIFCKQRGLELVYYPSKKVNNHYFDDWSMNELIRIAKLPWAKGDL